MHVLNAKMDSTVADNSSCSTTLHTSHENENESDSNSFSDPSEDDVPSEDHGSGDDRYNEAFSATRYNIVEKAEMISKVKHGMRKQQRKNRLKATSAPTLTDRARRARKHRTMGFPRHVAQRNFEHRNAKVSSVVPQLPAIGAQLIQVVKKHTSEPRKRLSDKDAAQAGSSIRQSIVAGRLKALDDDVERVAASFKVSTKVGEVCSPTQQNRCVQQTTWSLPAITSPSVSPTTLTATKGRDAQLLKL